MRIIVEDRRGAPDCLWAEARARPVRRRGVEGNAPDGDIDAEKFLGEAAAHEGERAGKGGIAGCRGEAGRREGVIDGLVRQEGTPFSVVKGQGVDNG
ncbi:hypothetical protein RHECNPAF_890040 [Rhizobium etli CNPAF512]|nr:hypothetical protein RHECNPAF_890040 [Rhizobium etli CNPAF512]